MQTKLQMYVNQRYYLQHCLICIVILSEKKQSTVLYPEVVDLNFFWFVLLVLFIYWKADMFLLLAIPLSVCDFLLGNANAMLVTEECVPFSTFLTNMKDEILLVSISLTLFMKCSQLLEETELQFHFSFLKIFQIFFFLHIILQKSF